MKKYIEYIENCERIISRIKNEEAPNIERAAELFKNSVVNGRPVFLFGTGHSHMLAEELFYRAGGLADIQPILETSLMLHESASKSTEIERLEGYAEIIFSHYGIKSGDVMVIISNSGRNGVIVDMALLCRERGVAVIALTNTEHAKAGASRHRSGKRLFEIADVVLDNCGCNGDASVSVDGVDGKICPTSTVAGALILNAVVAECVDLCAKEGVVPVHFASSNVDGGDEINHAVIELKRGEVRHL